MNDRFWKKVIKTDLDCWEWTGYKNPDGYGRVYVHKGRQDGAHRVSYELCVGPIPKGLQVLHKCDNPGCVRPDHLFVGTHRENIADKVKKRRQVKWKLTENEIKEILQGYNSGTSQLRLAELFNISTAAVHHIVKRSAWSWMEKEKQAAAITAAVNEARLKEREACCNVMIRMPENAEDDRAYYQGAQAVVAAIRARSKEDAGGDGCAVHGPKAHCDHCDCGCYEQGDPT